MQAPTAEPATTAVYALRLTCADDGGEHLVRDDLATTALVFGGQATAVCGHKVAPAPLLTMPTHRCGTCPQAATVLGLGAP